MNSQFYPGDRTYYASDDRLRAFRQLTPEQRLRWVEELASFLRMAKVAREYRKRRPDSDRGSIVERQIADSGR